jgi:hypothetical protein
MTELVPTPAVTKILARSNATVGEVLKAAVAEGPKVEAAQTPLPKDPALTESGALALEVTASKLAHLTLPETRRQLSPAELEGVITSFTALSTATKALENSKAQIKAAIFNHFDAVAAEKGLITTDTTLTKEGWAIVEDKTSGAVEGLPKMLTREVRGGTPSLTEASLHELVTEGLIDHEDYLAMTRQIRETDESRVMEWLRKNPAKASTLAKAVTTTAKTASLNLRDNK